MKSALEKIDSEMKLHHYKIRNFESKINFEFSRGSYLIKTVTNGDELEECLKLRFEVFHREYMNKKRNHGVDIDRLDESCDHLMIYDQKLKQTIGTYRLNSSLFGDTFYSAGEFNLGKILELPGNKLELGRACIHRDYRTGVVIALLWRGIAEYIQRTETKVLFGCSSVKTMEPLQIGLITKYLGDIGALGQEYEVTPTKKFRVKQLERVLEYIDTHPHEYSPAAVKEQLPALFQSYLRMNARICGEPALDREFHCIDFLTVIKMNELNSAHKEKYRV